MAAWMMVRVFLLIFVPTILVGVYYFVYATPFYGATSSFVVRTAEGGGLPSADGGLSGLLPGGAGGISNPQDSIAVQVFIESKEVMHRLDRDHDFRAHFSDESIDVIQRLPADATDEDMYDYYLRRVDVTFDPLEGIIHMALRAASPEASERFSDAIIGYSEVMVDGLSARVRESQIRDAERELEISNASLHEAQGRLTQLKASLNTIDKEITTSTEAQLLATLRNTLVERRTELSVLRTQTRNANDPRIIKKQAEIASIQEQIDEQEERLTGDGPGSLVEVTSALARAELDVETRMLVYTGALQQLQQAKADAARHHQFLATVVPPVAPDEATYPRKWENTALAFLIFLGAYIVISLTLGIIREQASV
jgi:capsular polysaccharide transport system permease protein